MTIWTKYNIGDVVHLFPGCEDDFPCHITAISRHESGATFYKLGYRAGRGCPHWKHEWWREDRLDSIQDKIDRIPKGFNRLNERDGNSNSGQQP